MRAQDHHHDHQRHHSSRVLYELSSMIIHILKSPPLSIPFPSNHPHGHLGTTPSSASASASASASTRQSSALSQVSPAGFASLFLGISLALMLFGSVTFVIGFILMPLVMGLVLLFYAVEILFNLSELGRSILCPASSPSRTHVPAWNFS
ncbi:Transmembrane protein [Trema orientale]|uniref:Transmembrane protein n=1 Tax=Trema orientale TaxID=63057 RepID=A0A2P5FC58_TREOI|nr:Transmembrane protein [Trema orientale]